MANHRELRDDGDTQGRDPRRMSVDDLKACGPDMEKLTGVIEIDETYIGGVEKNKHEIKKLKAGRGAVGKTAVLAMRERGGRTVAMPAESVDMDTVKKAIFDRIELGSTIRWPIGPSR